MTLFRFITPAVVAPENVDIELPTENRPTMRRGLMVVGKILQNLANNIFFGKEAYMTVLNKFLEGQIANVTRFLSEIHVIFSRWSCDFVPDYAIENPSPCSGV